MHDAESGVGASGAGSNELWHSTAVTGDDDGVSHAVIVAEKLNIVFFSC